MPKFAANLGMLFTELPFEQRFAAAARNGFKATELLFPYDHSPSDIAKWLDDNGLQNRGLNLWPGDFSAGERGLASLPGREKEFRSAVSRALEYAEATETPTLHAMCGIVPPGDDRTAHRAVYIENLRYAARELAKTHRTLLIEPINPRDIPGYFLNTQADAHAIVSEVGEPNLKVQMDFYHAQIIEGDLAIKFRKYFDNIGHVQIAGVPDRHEPDSGEVNYAYLLRMLDEAGYTGWVGCEYRPRRSTEEGLGWMQRLTEIVKR
ncbi:MAG: 2-oxo-tetronate isomerase [Burkholderiaceae bacterium]